MKRWLIVGVALLILAACVTPAPPRRVLPKRTYLPGLVNVFTPPTRAAWQWPKWGYGRPSQYAVSDAALRGGGMWWYDWDAHCLDAQQVPMAYSAISPELWQCNDGRPVLVLNEPDVVGQADRTPAQAVAVLHQVAERWQGEVYCCGTLAQDKDYMQAVVNAWRATYPDEVWPTSGLHVHLYSNRAVWQRDIDEPSYVAGALADLDAYVMWARGAGVLGRGVVISEYGALSSHGPVLGWHWPRDLVETFGAYAVGLRARPEVLSAAWFSSYYQPLSASDLLWPDGTFTELGLAWKGLQP